MLFFSWKEKVHLEHCVMTVIKKDYIMANHPFMLSCKQLLPSQIWKWFVFIACKHNQL